MLGYHPPGSDTTTPGPGSHPPPPGPGRNHPPGPGRPLPGPGRNPSRPGRPPPRDQADPPPRTRHTPPGSRLQHTVYKRPVRILLECILVSAVCFCLSVRRGGGSHVTITHDTLDLTIVPLLVISSGQDQRRSNLFICQLRTPPLVVLTSGGYYSIYGG